MWANKTGSIHLQVMCMPTPLRVWIMFLKGDREPWLLLAKISWERGPREGMLSTFSSLCCQFSVWLWEGREFLKGNWCLFVREWYSHSYCSDADCTSTLLAQACFWVPFPIALSRSSELQPSVSYGTWLCPWPLSTPHILKWIQYIFKANLKMHHQHWNVHSLWLANSTFRNFSYRDSSMRW